MESVYVFSSGTLRRKDNTLLLETSDGTKKHIPVENVSDLKIFGEISLNKRLLEFLTKKGIVAHFFNYEGYYVGTYYPRETNNPGVIFVRQVEHYIDPSKRIRIAVEFVKAAAKNMIELLKKHTEKSDEIARKIDNMCELMDQISTSLTVSQLMGIEGNIREAYYSALDEVILREDFKIIKREKRPPTNYANTLISFGNSLLYSTVLTEIFKTHLDPRVGYLHEANQRRFSLHLDIAEIFKPVIVDRVIIRLINRNQIKPSHFSKIAYGLKLNDTGKMLFAKEFEARLKETRYHPRLKRKVTYGTMIRLELYKLEKHLLGMENYKPYVHS